MVLLVWRRMRENLIYVDLFLSGYINGIYVGSTKLLMEHMYTKPMHVQMTGVYVLLHMIPDVTCVLVCV